MEGVDYYNCVDFRTMMTMMIILMIKMMIQMTVYLAMEREAARRDIMMNLWRFFSGIETTRFTNVCSYRECRGVVGPGQIKTSSAILDRDRSRPAQPREYITARRGAAGWLAQNHSGVGISNSCTWGVLWAVMSEHFKSNIVGNLIRGPGP